MLAVPKEVPDENSPWTNGDQTDWGLNFSPAPQVLRVSLGTYRAGNSRAGGRPWVGAVTSSGERRSGISREAKGEGEFNRPGDHEKDK